MSDKKVSVDKDLKELIPVFMDSRRKNIKELKEALQEDDFERIKQIGHDIKGAGGGYGFEEVTNLGKKLGEAADERKLSRIKELITKLENYLEEVEIIYE
jgi:HPt (histidine-containing phosphotransfer) domain-containing protein